MIEEIRHKVIGRVSAAYIVNVDDHQFPVLHHNISFVEITVDDVVFPAECTLNASHSLCCIRIDMITVAFFKYIYPFGDPVGIIFEFSVYILGLMESFQEPSHHPAVFLDL